MSRVHPKPLAIHPTADAPPQHDAPDVRPYAGTHHARFVDPDVPLHVISRVFQGRHLLRPCPELNDIILGVIGRAQQRYPRIQVHAFAFMSNHVHLMLQGPPDEVPAFIGFIKREISRRWGRRPEVNWPGAMWHEYLATALPTPESQVRCLAYILSQGVKEGLVARPEDWPGVHVAHALLGKRRLRGRWLNCTELARARDRERRRAEPKVISEGDYHVDYEVRLTPIPPWRNLDDASREREVRRLVASIDPALKRPLGAAAIRKIPMQRRTSLTAQPWFEDRRRMICWANPFDQATRRYLDRYWAFQRAFRESSRFFLAGEHAAPFPHGSFRPTSFSAGISAAA